MRWYRSSHCFSARSTVQLWHDKLQWHMLMEAAHVRERQLPTMHYSVPCTLCYTLYVQACSCVQVQTCVQIRRCVRNDGEWESALRHGVRKILGRESGWQRREAVRSNSKG